MLPYHLPVGRKEVQLVESQKQKMLIAMAMMIPKSATYQNGATAHQLQYVFQSRMEAVLGQAVEISIDDVVATMKLCEFNVHCDNPSTEYRINAQYGVVSSLAAVSHKLVNGQW